MHTIWVRILALLFYWQSCRMLHRGVLKKKGCECVNRDENQKKTAEESVYRYREKKKEAYRGKEGGT